ncbi:MAG: WGxxGxxG-CTERM domain-containing protein [Verrucomicrobia bacterium]|nr:WGxxGxxG-CTERM domain-containing protein [Verrucomicrobiota bacterium]
MKNHQLQLKRFISISTLALFVSATPLYAQTDAAQSPAQPYTVETNPGILGPDVQTRDRAMDMQRTTVTTDREIREPAGAGRATRNWSLLGLLGLLGLFGLKRRSDVHDENYRPLRT